MSQSQKPTINLPGIESIIQSQLRVCFRETTERLESVKCKTRSGVWETLRVFKRDIARLQ